MELLGQEGKVQRIESTCMLKHDLEMEGKSPVPGESDKRANHVRANTSRRNKERERVFESKITRQLIGKRVCLLRHIGERDATLLAMNVWRI